MMLFEMLLPSRTTVFESHIFPEEIVTSSRFPPRCPMLDVHQAGIRVHATAFFVSCNSRLRNANAFQFAVCELSSRGGQMVKRT